MNLSNATCKTVHDDRMNQTFPNGTFMCYVSEREPFRINQINTMNQDFLVLYMCDHSMNWFNSYARENCLGLSNLVTWIRLSSAAYVRENSLDFPVISTNKSNHWGWIHMLHIKKRTKIEPIQSYTSNFPVRLYKWESGSCRINRTFQCTYRCISIN